MIHELRINPKFFAEVRNGNKRFELRKNDRDFRVGDYLALNEWDGVAYTGRTELVQITYMLNPNDVMTCPAGWAVLSIDPVQEFDGHLEQEAAKGGAGRISE